jgi:hypothetical protein
MTPDDELDRGDAGVASLDWTDHDSPATAVAEAVAAATGREASELAPLQRTVDADALDRLLDGDSNAPGGGDVVVSFTYEGVTVRVDEHAVEVST